MRKLTLLRPARLTQWGKLYRLYRRAFPASERKPFSIIVNMYRKGKTDVWYMEADGKFAGFAATINDDNLILLDYFAVDEAFRKQGIGTAAMAQLQEIYADRGLFVEIESVCEEAPNRAQRERRKQFYLRCGLHPLNVTAEVFGVQMELLGIGCQMDFSRYHAFYHDNYSPWAAKNIIEATHPGNDKCP